jgi:hypothetical protein
MKFPAELRAKLLASPLLIKEDALFVFIVRGSVQRWPGATARHFFIDYTLAVILEGFEGPSDGLMLFINDWLDELAALDAEIFNEKGHAYEFDADIVNNDSIDITFLIPLREYVDVTEDANGITLEHS